MTRELRLTISTPHAMLVEGVACRAVRAEDETGGFGMLPGHADLLTVLPVSVVRWQASDGRDGACAVSGGILTVSGGDTVAIACRRGVVGKSVEDLPEDVLARFEADADADRRARVEQTRLHAEAVRHLMRYLRGEAGQGRQAP